MAFYLSNGDTKQTDVVIPTLKAKSYIIPGVTVRNDLQFTSAETLKYWVEGASSAAKVSTPGSQITFGAKALVAKTLVLTKSVQFADVIPGVNVETVSADQVNAQLTKEAIKASNLINEDFVTALETAASAGTYTYVGTDIYADLASMRAEYVNTNKTNGAKPTCAIVSPEVYSKLMAKNLLTFKENKPGMLFDMYIIECADTTKNAVLFTADAMVAGASYTGIKKIDAAAMGYANGVGVIGEIPYGAAAVEHASDFTGALIVAF